MPLQTDSQAENGSLNWAWHPELFWFLLQGAHGPWLTGIPQPPLSSVLPCYFHKHEQMRPTNCVWEHSMQISLVSWNSLIGDQLQTWTLTQSWSNLAPLPKKNVFHLTRAAWVLVWEAFLQKMNLPGFQLTHEHETQSKIIRHVHRANPTRWTDGAFKSQLSPSGRPGGTVTLNSGLGGRSLVGAEMQFRRFLWRYRKCNYVLCNTHSVCDTRATISLKRRSSGEEDAVL